MLIALLDAGYTVIVDLRGYFTDAATGAAIFGVGYLGSRLIDTGRAGRLALELRAR